jgi:hypothetical protein
MQLVLAALWLLDDLLKCQPFMFTTAFGQSLAATVPTIPRFRPRPITGVVTLVEQEAVVLNAVFAVIPLLPPESKKVDHDTSEQSEESDSGTCGR